MVINRGIQMEKDILIEGHRIAKIDRDISDPNAQIVDASGRWVIPGIIDDQVHFREPGLTYKADIYTESRAALAGGVTAFMEMPNTKPTATSQQLLEDKYAIARDRAITNYSFYMGATNENIEEVLRTDPKNVCGIKVFMGSSTGNMLVDNEMVLQGIFSEVDMLIATHCEDEATIRHNMALYKDRDDLSARYHPVIRSREGCYLSSALAVGLAQKYGSRLHVLHISTAEEVAMFESGAVTDKRITAEACVHHLYFDDTHYPLLGNSIKCNPAIKSASDKAAILQGLLDDRIDVIATDHAPHTWAEKSKPYAQAPSGLPLIQHTLLLMLHHYHQGRVTPEFIVRKMCHAPADLFRITDRGYLDEGAWADITIVDPWEETIVEKKDLRYKCAWSPLEGMQFSGAVKEVFVNGVLKYQNGSILSETSGMRLVFKT